MILVDSSVWIDYFRATDTPQVALLDSMLGRSRLAVGDLIAAEVLQGVRDERAYRWVKKTLDAFDKIDLCDHALALKASENFRLLRAKGIKVRKTIDTVIATRCIEDGLTLLHADRDFRPFAEHLGLREAYLSIGRTQHSARTPSPRRRAAAGCRCPCALFAIAKRCIALATVFLSGVTFHNSTHR